MRVQSVLLRATALTLAFGVAPAHASMMVGEWFHGSWNCRIDGRPSKMTWRVVDDPQTSCRGDECTTTSGVTLRGRFSDNGSQYVPLRKTSSTAASLNFRHADGNPWRLNRRSANLADGYTTWQGQRYPLSCRKA